MHNSNKIHNGCDVNDLALVCDSQHHRLYYNVKKRFFVATRGELAEHVQQLIMRIREQSIGNTDEFTVVDTSLKTVDIIPGNGCNLRCDYCYREEDHKLLDVSKLSQALSFLKRSQAPDDTEFCFIGGEPLLYIDNIIEFVSEIKQSHKNAGFVIVTNGTLLTESTCKYFSKEHFQVVISVDGKPKVHNLSRRHKDGSGTFEQVERGILLSKKHSLIFALCLTVQKNNINTFPEDVAWLIDRYAPHDVHVNGILHEPTIEDNKVNKEFARGLFRLMQNFNNISRPLPKQIQRWFMPFIKPNLSMHFDCAAFGRKIVVSPDGFHTCEGFASDKKCVDCSELDDLVQHWKQYNFNTIESCKACVLRYACKGGCKFNANRSNGRSDYVDTHYCITNRYLFAKLARLVLSDFQSTQGPFNIYTSNEIEVMCPSLAPSAHSTVINWS